MVYAYRLLCFIISKEPNYGHHKYKLLIFYQFYSTLLSKFKTYLRFFYILAWRICPQAWLALNEFYPWKQIQKTNLA